MGGSSWIGFRMEVVGSEAAAGVMASTSSKGR